jgi:hypothetical protein
MKQRVLALEGGVLLVLGVASILSGRLLGAAILVGLGMLAGASAWAFWAVDHEAAASSAALADDLVEKDRPRHRGV